MQQDFPSVRPTQFQAQSTPPSLLARRVSSHSSNSNACITPAFYTTSLQSLLPNATPDTHQAFSPHVQPRCIAVPPGALRSVSARAFGYSLTRPDLIFSSSSLHCAVPPPLYYTIAKQNQFQRPPHLISGIPTALLSSRRLLPHYTLYLVNGDRLVAAHGTTPTPTPILTLERTSTLISTSIFSSSDPGVLQGTYYRVLGRSEDCMSIVSQRASDRASERNHEITKLRNCGIAESQDHRITKSPNHGVVCWWRWMLGARAKARVWVLGLASSWVGWLDDGVLDFRVGICARRVIGEAGTWRGGTWRSCFAGWTGDLGTH
ncbi:hypothetical protein K491DRAFT_685499 [Lophiostoma macrostomum CBS 122681]|uniref:Uncharacterized protein n=1 Tax=Lophiostoma macrostomum CBS 122681 TaxID=1314788 RepID=A0A6A6SI85_9PLEO|nr:hypothetical protein K491DRAFT_685499 [Lophiostoma macrostomum CBS 122681]